MVIIMERLYRYVVKGGSMKNPDFLFQTNDIDELVIKIKEYASKKVIKQYYWRILDYEDYAMIDYGSWSDFVFVYFADKRSKEYPFPLVRASPSTIAIP